MDFKKRLIIYFLLIVALIIVIIIIGFQYQQDLVLTPDLVEDMFQDPTIDFILRILRLILPVILIISAILEVIFKIKKIKSLEETKGSGQRRRGRFIHQSYNRF